MANENLVLYVASYGDAAAAAEDFQSLKDAQAAEDFAVVGAVVASRDDAGEVTVDEHGAASPVGGGTALGATGGIVVGLFAPPLLLATAIGAGIGAGIGELKKRHEEKQFGVDIEEYLPPGSSAVLVVATTRTWIASTGRLRSRARRSARPSTPGDYEKLAKELEDADKRVSDAIDS